MAGTHGPSLVLVTPKAVVRHTTMTGCSHHYHRGYLSRIPRTPQGGKSHSCPDRLGGQCYLGQDQARWAPDPAPLGSPGPGDSVNEGKNHTYGVIVSVLSELIGPVLPPKAAQSVLARHHCTTGAAAAGQEPEERWLAEASAGPSSCAQELPREPHSLVLLLCGSLVCSGTVLTGEGRTQSHRPAGSCRPTWPVLTPAATRGASD